MKKFALLILVVVIAALSVMAVSAAPRDRYYDQMGNKHWCNSDSYGCWVTGENGEKEYIMFWSEAAAAMFMGPDSGAPIGTNPGTSELPLMPPKPPMTASRPDGRICTAEELKKKGTCTPDKPWSEDDCDCVPSQPPAPPQTCPRTVQSCEADNPGKTCIVKDDQLPNCSCDCN